MAKRSFSHFVEQEMGKFPHFLIFAVLEWVLIGLLFLDGIIAFVADQFARLVGLRRPCVVCTRIDHVLIPRRDRDSYLIASLCDSHQAKVSALATSNKNNETNCNSSINNCCGCGGEALRKRLVAAAAVAPALSPRARLWMRRRGSEIPFDPSALAGFDLDDKFREDLKAAMLANDPYETNIIESSKTPIFSRSSSRFYGVQLSNSGTNTPRLTSRLSRKFPLESTELPSEMTAAENNNSNSDNIDKGTILESDSVSTGAKSQSNLDPKSLIELYTELDEERSASAVAANNAMAMITRLQAEKAAVQMEALQYQRMMEEQFEYDQEALQEANDLLLKKEEDISALESELEAYRERFGWLNEDGEEEDPDHDHDHDQDRDHHRNHDEGQHKSSKSSYSSGSVRTEMGSSCMSLLGEEDGANGGVSVSESLKDFKEERTYVLGRKKLDSNEDSCENGEACPELNHETDTETRLQ